MAGTKHFGPNKPEAAQMSKRESITQGRRSLRFAIDAKCRDCCFDALCGGGTWREQVAQCSSLNCPLWPVRPAPASGPFSNPYRDPKAVPREWVKLPVGSAFSPHPTADQADSELGGRP